MPTMEQILARHFGHIGARAVLTAPRSREQNTPSLDIRRDGRGEYFQLRLPARATAAVLQHDAKDRHLLLLVSTNGEKSRFLCGHDERHWFVAAIPESEAGVVNIRRAKEALQPPAVRTVASALRRKERQKRRTRVFLRQGEWFFVPVPNFKPDPISVRRNEPLSRGRGKFHMMESAVRLGGANVYVSREHPDGLTQDAFEALPDETRRRQTWRQMVRDARVYAMGRVRHPDHATLVLNGWHRVFMNTEAEARAMRHVVFLD